LFFVGMTRTPRILVFSSYFMLPDTIVRRITSRTGRRYGRSLQVFPSRFLEQCGRALPRAIRGAERIVRYRR
jgi:hypothetical protein